MRLPAGTKPDIEVQWHDTEVRKAGLTMTPMLVPQIVWNSLRPLQNALKRNGHRHTPNEVRELIEACTLEELLLEKLWERNRKLLEHGAEGRQLRLLLKESLDAVEESLRLFAGVQDIATREQTPLMEQQADRTMLETVSRRAEHLRGELTALLHWLDAPSPPIDPATLTGGGDSSTAKGYESIDDILARLQAGGDV
jgi:hypothetical protein